MLITEAEPVEEPGPRIIYANAAFERMSGYRQAEVLGRTPRLLQGANTSPEARATIRQALKRWEPVRVELINYRKDGTEFWTELSMTPMADETGRFTHWVSIQRDTTERRRTEAALRESEARYGRIAANVPGMVYQFGLHPDGSLALPFVSEGCREIFGLEPVQVQADTEGFLGLICPEDRPDFYRRIAASARTLEPWAWQGHFTRPDTGERRCVQAASRPGRHANGDVVWDGVLMDVTERERSVEHRRAKEEAERANAAKSEFLSRMSHELRTPLNAILGFGQLMEMDDLGGRQQESVGQILSAGRHLLALVDEVLDLAHVESGRIEMTLHAVNLAELVGEALGLIRPLAIERGIRLESDPGLGRDCAAGSAPHVLADRQRLTQVLLNLLANAVKYNRPAGGEVFVGVRGIAPTGPGPARQRVRVRDTGAGIDAAGLAKLFTPFERLGAAHGPIEGSGLGLAVCKQLVEAMGGSIGVESTPGRGSTFWVELPSVPASRDAAALPALAAPATG